MTISKLFTYYNQYSRQVASSLGGLWPAADWWRVVLPHPGEDLLVDDHQVAEGDDAGDEQPGPVDVVVHVVLIHPEQQLIVYEWINVKEAQ